MFNCVSCKVRIQPLSSPDIGIGYYLKSDDSWVVSYWCQGCIDRIRGSEMDRYGSAPDGVFPTEWSNRLALKKGQSQ